MNNGTKLIMHACPRWRRAYLEDPRDGDWRCLQCARTVRRPTSLRRGATSAPERQAA